MDSDIRRLVEQYPMLALQVNVGERHRIKHLDIPRGSLWITPKATCYSVAPSGQEVEALMLAFLRRHFGTQVREYPKWKEWDVEDLEAIGAIIRHYANSPTEELAFALPEELRDSDALFEGSAYRVVVNAYERNPQARFRCIAHHGARCVVCGFDFGRFYGPVAIGHIHVHHLTPLASVGKQYEVDPRNDLRPVCANCHSVIHLGGVLRSVEDVRAMIAEANRHPQRQDSESS